MAEGNILTGSDYYTYINGTAGTLPEALGYITSGDTATYYLYVLASEGGSVSESFTLDYSVSTACDSYEIDESVRQALAFTYGAGGAYIESRNLSSPIDNLLSGLHDRFAQSEPIGAFHRLLVRHGRSAALHPPQKYRSAEKRHGIQNIHLEAPSKSGQIAR